MDRRAVLGLGAAATFGAVASRMGAHAPRTAGRTARARPETDLLTVFLCGDVMTGRGIDQALPHSCDPRLHEQFVQDARVYASLAERANGAIERPLGFSAVWGDALDELARAAPAARIVNLETAITTSDDWWRGKGINYRMHPGNVTCLTEAGIDCCALANNHVLDWGRAGLSETLETLERAGIASAGAGRSLEAAQAPAILDVAHGRRVIVFSFGSVTSGIPHAWAAREDRGGVDLLDDLSPAAVDRIAGRVRDVKRAGDVVIASVHWGVNWSYAIGGDERAFAHALIERAGVDVVHGHSSHHPKGIEVHRGKLVLHGCGDFLNDYEGIGGHEKFRGDLGLMYFVTVDRATGALVRLRLVPTRVRRFRVRRATATDARWLLLRLNREGKPLGTRAVAREDGSFSVQW